MFRGETPKHVLKPVFGGETPGILGGLTPPHYLFSSIFMWAHVWGLIVINQGRKRDGAEPGPERNINRC